VLFARRTQHNLALVNILTSSGADVATITEFNILEGNGEFSVAGYTTFSLTPSLQGGKTRVLILVKNDLAVRANVKVIADSMDPAVQSVWLHFSHHRRGSGSATLGTFILGGIYREWTPLLSHEESRLRLGSLLQQISKAADGSGVLIHGDFNVDLDRVDNGTYYMAMLAKSLAECTATAGLETHATPPTFRSYGNLSPIRRETSHVRPETSQVLQDVGKVRQEVCQVRPEMGKVRQATSTSTPVLTTSTQRGSFRSQRLCPTQQRTTDQW
jgi:hypothetical protein